jgi:hypothetical protein
MKQLMTTNKFALSIISTSCLNTNIRTTACCTIVLWKYLLYVISLLHLVITYLRLVLSYSSSHSQNSVLLKNSYWFIEKKTRSCYEKSDRREGAKRRGSLRSNSPRTGEISELGRRRDYFLSKIQSMIINNRRSNLFSGRQSAASSVVDSSYYNAD